jgi:hypothetical protein
MVRRTRLTRRQPVKTGSPVAPLPPLSMEGLKGYPPLFSLKRLFPLEWGVKGG